MDNKEQNFDVEVFDEGSIVLFCPKSKEAKDWIKENVQAESWQFLGENLSVDHSYAENLAEGMIESGLLVSCS